MKLCCGGDEDIAPVTALHEHADMIKCAMGHTLFPADVDLAAGLWYNQTRSAYSHEGRDASENLVRGGAALMPRKKAITLEDYHSAVQIRQDGLLNIYPADSTMLPDFHKFLDRHYEDPENLFWDPPFLECICQDQEQSFRLLREEGEKKGGIPLSPILATAISVAIGRDPSIPDDLFQMKSLIVERLGRYPSPYLRFELWKGKYFLSDYKRLYSLGSKFYYSPGDWTAIGRMKKLKVLKIENLAIHDFSFLTNLTNLQKLNLSGTNFSQDEVLAGLKNLQQLDLPNTGFSDCRVLLQLPKLKRVNLAHCHLQNEDMLQQLTADIWK